MFYLTRRGASLCVVLAVAWTTSPLSSRGQEWRPAPAPLKTPWTKDVSPAHARPEYPRPQFVRDEWKSLNGLWEFAFDDANRGRSDGWSSGKPLPEKILVPWTFEASLSGIGKGQEVHERVWYRRTFDVPPGWRGQRLLLHFGAVDWESIVWVNGKEVGTHRGGYTPFSFDVTPALKADGPQEVVVAVYDPADPKKGATQPKGKQLGSHSIWYTRTTGIWQTVWLEPVPEDHIRAVQIDADLSRDDPPVGIVRLQLSVAGRQGRMLSRDIVLSLDGKPVAHASVDRNAPNTEEQVLRVRSPRAWSPESPTLYDLVLTLRDGERIVDQVKSYTAFRSVTLTDKRICLNGRPYFLRGVLDQGFWPDGIYTPPTDEAIRNEVVMTKAFGLNLARKHVKVEDPRWYYYCDKLGLLVAQDMPSSHNLDSSEARQNFEQEWREVLTAVRNHPSIILWIPFNEDWGKPGAYQDHIVDVTHALDPLRPVIDASGWTQRDKTDITDIHDYGNDLKRHARPEPPRPTWIGEYGGVALPVAGHTWVKGWGYQTVKTPEELLTKYKFLTDQINEAPGLSGFVYTQLTDVEQELNGLMTYDRIPKAPPEDFAAINRKERGVRRSER
jgi:beta-galactosidase/beta-glucuronidase